MNFALKYSSFVDKLIIVDIAPVSYPIIDTFSQLIDYLKSMDLSKIHTRKEAEDYLTPLIPV